LPSGPTVLPEPEGFKTITYYKPEGRGFESR
jgi:hypothetical protein